MNQIKSFYELMTMRVDEILLVSSPYDAFIMQEDGRLSERIIHEYRGLNLTRPPRLTWVSSGVEAFEQLDNRIYDIVIVMPHISDMDSYDLCTEIKSVYKELPVYYFAYDAGKLLGDHKCHDRSIIDRAFVWSGNTDLLMAIVKNREDFLNVDHDTATANVRVIIFVEDSPLYISSLLPYIYKEIVMQTQAVMDESLNEKDRILRMRTRPKILLAENYEDAWSLYQKYSRYLLCVISDVRFPQKGIDDPHAGVKLLTKIKNEMPDIPLLMLSSEPANRKLADPLSAFFLDKSAPTLHAEIRNFLVHYLGFGDFIFRLNDGTIVGRASNLRSMGAIFHSIPDESIEYHVKRNDFSRWLIARFEMNLALEMRPLTLEDFKDIKDIKLYFVKRIRDKLKVRQKGLITDFIKESFDPENDFMKIGRGSLGGKARGLAFISNFFREYSDLHDRFPAVTISLPKILVITTEAFDDFEHLNNTREFLKNIKSDMDIKNHFRKSRFPEWLSGDLAAYLEHVTYPLAVRSSAILEDAHYRPSAGAYNTYMLPNNHPDIKVRLAQLVEAVKLVYASIYQEMPRLLARNSVYRPEEDKMAVIIQQLSGTKNQDHFYPAISGVAQSWNFYPVSYMKPEEGVAHIALGLGKIVVDGGVALRFSPKYPEFLPQFSSVEAILKNAQRYFYALNLDGNLSFQGKNTGSYLPGEPNAKKHISTDIPGKGDMKENNSGDIPGEADMQQNNPGDIPGEDRLEQNTSKHAWTNGTLATPDHENNEGYFHGKDIHGKNNLSKGTITCTDFNLSRLDVDDALDHRPVQKLLSTYMPEDNRIRDFFTRKGYPVLTFASVLKLKEVPLAEIISRLLEIGKTSMGCPVEIEFAMNLFDDKNPDFSLLQIRPMMVAQHNMDVEIGPKDVKAAFCYSDKAMGSSQITRIFHIIYVKPDTFDNAATIEIAKEIEQINVMFIKEKRELKREDTHLKYLLIGPGRWGTTDPWLGIPIKWSQITHVGTIIETVSDKLNADPSQGSHFFHNITSLGINYLGVPAKDGSFIDWDWLNTLPAHTETRFLRYIKLTIPAVIKIDGRTSTAVILKKEINQDEQTCL
ncbi:MAG: hypothetical protein HQK66_01300 [Desulfamplus sp.]|nr:hypothetical protein [Desulfamplus sp.]